MAVDSISEDYIKVTKRKIEKEEKERKKKKVYKKTTWRCEVFLCL
jgi:hypothetical protein